MINILNLAFLALILPACKASKSDENAMLEWRIYPTSVKVENEPQESRELSRNPRDQGDQNAEEPDGPVSRQQLFHDLLKDRRREIHVEDFLWTGSGDGELPDTDFDIDPSSDPENRLDVKILPTTLTVTEVSTLFVGHATDAPSYRVDILPTPVLPPVLTSATIGGKPDDEIITSSHPYVSAATPPSELPLEKYIVRTILHSNMTIIHNRVEDFKRQMEQKLTRAYRRAYDKDKLKSRWERSVPEEPEFFPHGRFIRSAVEKKTLEETENKPQLQQPRAKRHRTPPRVMIHNIRSALPQPEIEVLYTVYQDDEPIPAMIAVEALREVEDSDVEGMLGFPLVKKAEPYTSALVAADPTVTHSLMGALVVSFLVIVLVVLALLFLLHRAKRAGLSLKQSRLLGSPDHCTTMESSHAQTSPEGSMDRAAFTLQSSGKMVRVASPQDTKSPPTSIHQEDNSRAQTASIEAVTEKGRAQSRASSRGPSRGPAIGAESPSMADLSSNNGDESPQRAKRGESRNGAKRKSRQSQNRNLLTPTGYSSGGEIISQSAFPIPTPDRLGPLTDLLEEDDQTPLESRENSGKKRPDWSFLPRPKTPGSTTSSSESYAEDGRQASPWQNEVAKTRVMAKRYSKVLDETFGTQVEVIEDIEATEEAEPDCAGEKSTAESSLKKRAVSAKSHIFRKGKIETKLAKMGRHHRTRPWSAHESRLQADPIFHMRKKHWEGLIAGKKRLHRGQLLPGSTSSTGTSEDESRKNPPTCWSECSSPRKQVRIEQPEVVGGAQDVATPLIKAIKEELQKFQRPKSPNLAGISIINDPDLLQQDK